MSKVRFRHAADDEWTAVGDVERKIHYRQEDCLELFEIRAGAGYTTPLHAHPEDEVIVVLSGSIRLGAQVCEPGASVLVPKDTPYRFVAGDEGCHYLNFRPRPAGMLVGDELRRSRDHR